MTTREESESENCRGNGNQECSELAARLAAVIVNNEKACPCLHATSCCKNGGGGCHRSPCKAIDTAAIKYNSDNGVHTSDNESEQHNCCCNSTARGDNVDAHPDVPLNNGLHHNGNLCSEHTCDSPVGSNHHENNNGVVSEYLRSDDACYTSSHHNQKNDVSCTTDLSSASFFTVADDTLASPGSESMVTASEGVSSRSCSSLSSKSSECPSSSSSITCALSPDRDSVEVVGSPTPCNNSSIVPPEEDSFLHNFFSNLNLNESNETIVAAASCSGDVTVESEDMLHQNESPNAESACVSPNATENDVGEGKPHPEITENCQIPLTSVSESDQRIEDPCNCSVSR